MSRHNIGVDTLGADVSLAPSLPKSAGALPVLFRIALFCSVEGSREELWLFSAQRGMQGLLAGIDLSR